MDLKIINIKQYRIKTEKEFKAEFGEDWRREASWSFPDWMDHLLGRKLYDLKIVYKGIDRIIIKDVDIDNNKPTGWAINDEALKKITKKKEKIQWF